MKLQLRASESWHCRWGDARVPAWTPPAAGSLGSCDSKGLFQMCRRVQMRPSFTGSCFLSSSQIAFEGQPVGRGSGCTPAHAGLGALLPGPWLLSALGRGLAPCQRGAQARRREAGGSGDVEPVWAGTAVLGSTGAPNKLLSIALLSLGVGEASGCWSGPLALSSCVGSRPPACGPPGSPVPQARPPHVNPECRGGGWAWGLLPCGRGPAGLEVLGGDQRAGTAHLCCLGMAQRGLCSIPTPRGSLEGAGQAVVSAGDVCSCVLV